jgi:hypothetical protein
MNLRILLLALVVTGVAGSLTFRWLRRTRDTDELERRRRARLSKIGRITEGHVMELVEVAPQVAGGTVVASTGLGASLTGDSPRRLVCYSYSISGVGYETAQDITGVTDRIETHRLVAGQPVSIKYDPLNPGDSILIADDWSGLH